MENIIKIGRNIVTNFRLGFWFFTSLFLTYYSAFIAEKDFYKFIFAFLAMIFAGVFVNLYTDMFGTSKTKHALDALFSILDDFYYQSNQNTLTDKENELSRRVTSIIKILDSDDTRIELFRKYKKEQIARKTVFFQSNMQQTTFNSEPLRYSDMILNSYGDPKNIQASGSADSLVDPTP